ncbi:MAG: acyl--CoA ligase [Clostridia bacterium]|nr:acyl--CoA ligase [Clostridia bacterium]
MEQTNLTGYPSIDKPWLKYYTKEDLAIKVPTCTVYQNIYDRNKDHPNDVAILYYGNKIRYKALFSNVELCAKALRQIGIHSGDCVTLCTAGVPEAIYLVLACSRIGAIANFLNPLFTKEQMIERINETEAKWIFVLDAMYSYIEAALPETCIENVVVIPATNSIPPLLSKALYWKSPTRKILRKGNERQHHLSWKDFCSFSCAYEGAPDVPYQPDTPTVMVYSSGSTGASKGILLTNDGINATVANYQTHSYEYERGDTFLQMIPIWFSTGIVLSILMPLVQGITVIPEPKFSKESFVNDLLKYRPVLTLTATSLWIYAATSNEMEKSDFSNMKYPITGGEKYLPQDELKISEFLKGHGCTAEMIKGYGMCELGGTVSTSSHAIEYSGKVGGAGAPILNVIASAFDISSDKELPYGQHGEIRVLSPARMKGYYKNPEATAEFFKTDKHGNIWGCTGDIGYVDEDGEIFILGRAKDHFHRDNGEIVYLFDIEGEILKDEAVDQCKVVYFKTSSSTVTVAHIVFRKDVPDTKAALERIHRRLIRTLPDYMIPQYYKARAAMPVHTNGKLDVYALRDDREGLVSGEQLK